MVSRRVWTLASLASLVALLAPPWPTVEAQTTPDVAAIDVEHYNATIEPDVGTATIKGSVEITVRRTTPGARLQFDAAALTVDGVEADGQPLPFAREDRALIVTSPQGASAGARLRLVIRYHGAPRQGIQFSTTPPFVFTVFATSQWLICVDAPSDRATFDLALIVPARFAVVANGAEVDRRRLDDDRVVSRWRNARPMPTYTFGFAAGAFVEATLPSGKVRASLLGAGLSTDELQWVFADTAPMLEFFAERAGLPYQAASYTQVLAGTGVGQEMSEFSVLPASYGQDVLRTGDRLLGAHELAHQWWGNRVTCADWTHFWLNEGMATFMSAAWLERAGGRDAYERQIDVSRQRYLAARAAGHDHALVFERWIRPTPDDRTIVYHKGAYVLSLLRERLGESRFWAGIRSYTQQHDGVPVTTADFQAAMEGATGQDLSGFFAEWVY